MKYEEIQPGIIYKNEKNLHRKFIAFRNSGVDYIKVARNIHGDFYAIEKDKGKPIVRNCCIGTFMKWAKQAVSE